MNEIIKSMIMKSVTRGRVRYGLDGDTITKVWNQGNGRLALFTIQNDALVVNAGLWRKTDAALACVILRATDSIKRIVAVDYGYPYYYNHAFGLHNPPASEVTERRIKRDIADYGKRSQNAA